MNAEFFFEIYNLSAESLKNSEPIFFNFELFVTVGFYDEYVFNIGSIYTWFVNAQRILSSDPVVWIYYYDTHPS